MKTASIRDLRLHFPKLKEVLEREGEILVTDRGRAAYVLRTYTASPRRAPPVDYFARLRARQPRAISRAASRALDEENRGDR